jgi:hypothetical protein
MVSAAACHSKTITLKNTNPCAERGVATCSAFESVQVQVGNLLVPRKAHQDITAQLVCAHRETAASGAPMKGATIKLGFTPSGRNPCRIATRE